MVPKLRQIMELPVYPEKILGVKHCCRKYHLIFNQNLRPNVSQWVKNGTGYAGNSIIWVGERSQRDEAVL